MSYIRSALIDGEYITYIGFPSLWGHFKALAAAALLCAAGGVALAKGQGGLAVYLLVAPPNLLLYVWLMVSSVEIAVTSKRVLVKTGIIKRDTSELYLTRIEGVEVVQSAIGRILGFGSLHIRGTGDQVAVVRNIANPLAFRRAVFSAGDSLISVAAKDSAQDRSAPEQNNL